MMTMTKHGKNPKKSVFYRIYFAVLLVVLALLGIGLWMFSDYLRDYENALPKYVAREVTEDYFSPPDYGKLYDSGYVTLSEYEGRDTFITYMTDQFGTGEMTCSEIPAGLGDRRQYRVRGGEKTLATFTLKKKAEKSRHGFDLWEPEAIVPAAAGTGTVQVDLLAGSSLTVGGRPANPNDRTETGMATPSCAHMPEGVSGMRYDHYTFTGLLGTPVLAATDAQGTAAQLVYDEDKKTYVEQPNNDAALAADFSERAKLAAQAYARFMTRDAYTGVLDKYFDETSETYALIRNSDTWCYSNHLGYEFADEQIDAFYAYDPDTFSCRYRCTHNVFFTKNDTRVFTLDLTLYFRRIGETFFVYDLVTNS